MDKSRQIFHPAADSDITPIQFWGNIVIAALGLLANIVLLRTALQLPDATISYVARAFHSLVILATSLVILMTLRGHQKFAAQIVFYTAILLLASGSFIYAEDVFSASFSLITISTVIVSELLPKELRRRAIVMTGVVWMIILAAAWINPSWRLPARAAAGAGLATSILFALILGVIVFRQSWKIIVSSIRIQITLWTGLLVAVLSFVLVGYSIITSRQAAINSAEAESLAVAKAHAETIKNQVAPALDSARTLAYSLGVGKDPDYPASLTREQANAILRKVAEENPTFLGIWTIWEPNAFDGLDAQFANTPLHDSTGRFIPYWVRVSDSVRGEAIRDYETPGLNDFYSIPRQTKQETIIPPYFYQVGGEDVLMTSLVVPIVENDRFYGVVGVDLKIDFLQGIVDEIDLYDGTATAVIMTDQGTLVAVGDQPDLALQPASSIYPDFEQILPRITAGETFTSLSPDGQYLRVFSPVGLGETGTHSSLSLIIPFAAITPSVTESAIQEVVIGLSIIIISLLILWFFTGRLLRPVIDLTAVANTISTGNLNAVADSKAPNEFGILAKAFNSMTSQLRNTLDTLEQRVAVRTRDLATVAEVGTATATILDSDRLLQEVVDLTRERFGLYHAHIYLLDDAGKNLVLTAGAGEPGRIMVAEGRSIPLDREQSLVARAARERKGVTANDVTQAPDFLPNPLLPDTRSELAVPMMVGGALLGVFDIQSEQVGRFTESDIHIQTTLASLVATSIQNVRTFERSQKQAELEAWVNTIGQKIQRATSIEETLQVGIRELGLALGAPEVSASISRREDDGNLNGNHRRGS
jgi:putative methionine-R-sulfoxide reductase with GAF domain